MISINGRIFKGNNVTIRDGSVVVDGKRVDDHGAKNGILEIKVEGAIGELTTDASVHCGNVTGDIQAGGSVSCNDVGGDIQCGGSVACDKVDGDIQAGGSVRHG